jgi:hypothetical protein
MAIVGPVAATLCVADIIGPNATATDCSTLGNTDHWHTG